MPHPEAVSLRRRWLSKKFYDIVRFVRGCSAVTRHERVSRLTDWRTGGVTYFDDLNTRFQRMTVILKKRTAWRRYFHDSCRFLTVSIFCCFEYRYISVDIYGKCSNLSCPSATKCWETIEKNYKFYLALENSNCRDYITEKAHRNALR